MVESHDYTRIDALDFARFIAFAGMVLVNFKVVMAADPTNYLATTGVTWLEGKPSAVFIVLAGVGVGLAAQIGNRGHLISTSKRALFLLVMGLLNSIVFDADIIHYYAVYFLFGALLVHLTSKELLASILALNFLYVLLLFTFDYEAGWKWNDYSYTDFWTFEGFMRNLFFNGWHPVIPWIGFLFLGIIFSRLSLNKLRTQLGFVIIGALAVAIAEYSSAPLATQLSKIDIHMAFLATTAPLPPAPLYFLTSAGAAALLLGLCLLIFRIPQSCTLFYPISLAGRQTLTLYMAHILIGMGIMQYFGLIGGQSITLAYWATLLFMTASIIYALIWSRYFSRGPIELLMRKTVG